MPTERSATSRNARDQRLVRLFTMVSIAEAVSWAGLLAGMYAKYVSETTELGVRVFGSIHGAIFIAYVLLTLAVSRRLRWRVLPTTLLALAASVPPFMTAAFEVWARKRGHLTVPARTLDSPELVPARALGRARR
jgi:integral membrane protein